MRSGISEQIAATRGIQHYPVNALPGSLPIEKDEGFPIIRPGTSITTPYSGLARESKEAPIQASEVAELGPKGAITVDLQSKNWEAILLEISEKISGSVPPAAGISYAVEYAVSELLRNACEYGGSLDGTSRLARVVWNVAEDSPFVVISNDLSTLFNPVKYLNRSVEELYSDVEACSTVNSHIFLQSLACSAKHLEFTWESPSRGEVIQCTLQKLSNNIEEEEVPFRLVVACTKDGFPQSDFNLFQYLENNQPPPAFEKFSLGVEF